MKGMVALVIIGLFPLLMGTTYVVKEGGVEVGRWEENDGKSEVKEITSDVSKQISRPKQTRKNAEAPAPQVVTPDAGAESLAKEKSYVSTLDRDETFGIREGMSEEAAEKIAEEHHFYSRGGIPKFSHSGSAMTQSQWVKRYEYRTKHYEHTLDVTYGTTEFSGNETIVLALYHQTKEIS